MSPAGWILLVVSLSFVFGLTGWCYYKVLTTTPEPSED